ncbi:hypothetical protein CCUS01_02438, partial [Colletotrichum cuscutae]
KRFSKIISFNNTNNTNYFKLLFSFFKNTIFGLINNKRLEGF